MALIKSNKKESIGFSHLGHPTWFWFWTCSECDTKYIEINGKIMLNGQRIYCCPYCRCKIKKGIEF